MSNVFLFLAYSDCRVNEDPCLNKYCPPDMTCEVYTPPHCPECDVGTECVSTLHVPDDVTTHVPYKSSASKKLSVWIIYCVTFYLIYLVVI